MSFAAPASAALAGLAALIVIQYILKLRRPARTVPSTFLWQRALADSRANAPWQRLKPDALLLLQLLALTALVLALMRPYVLRAGTVGEDVVAVAWMIEELRVSLFAQRLGTAYPVSAKRIRKAIDAVERG